ncbi:MAG: hypothetical protein ACLTR4_05470 [Gallintestinimicrobium sp.]
MEEKGLLKELMAVHCPFAKLAVGRPETMTFKDIPQVKPNYLQIAKRSRLIDPGKRCHIHSSTTLGLFMVKNLPEHLKIKVVTNSILIADELRILTDVSVIILGGEMDNKGNCCGILSLLKPLKGSVLTNASLPLFVSLHPLTIYTKVRLI